MKKILIEASALEQDRPSGVNYFTDGFSRALEENLTDTEVSYFWLNFLGKKSPINPLVKAAFESGRLVNQRPANPVNYDDLSEKWQQRAKELNKK